jgi:putative transposase
LRQQENYVQYLIKQQQGEVLDQMDTNINVPNLVGDPQIAAEQEAMFSDIFDVQLADRSKVRGCFALWKRTRHILALTFDYSMRADLVVSAIELVEFCVPGTIWHSDQGSPYGAEQTRAVLLRKGFERYMSRAGTPTDYDGTRNLDRSIR